MYMYRHTSSAAVFSNKHLNVQILSISLKVASWVYQAVSQPGMSVLYERRKLYNAVEWRKIIMYCADEGADQKGQKVEKWSVAWSPT